MRILEFDSFETEQEKREMQLQEPVAAKKNVFIYTVYEDDEETEAFHADVRDPNGTIIFEIKKKDFPENPEEEEAYELEEEKEGATPRMHDANDIASLRKILIAKGKMTENDVLMSNEVYKESGEVERPEVPPVNINMMENNRVNLKHIKLFESYLSRGGVDSAPFHYMFEYDDTFQPHGELDLEKGKKIVEKSLKLNKEENLPWAFNILTKVEALKTKTLKDATSYVINHKDTIVIWKNDSNDVFYAFWDENK